MLPIGNGFGSHPWRSRACPDVGYGHNLSRAKPKSSRQRNADRTPAIGEGAGPDSEDAHIACRGAQPRVP